METSVVQNKQEVNVNEQPMKMGQWLVTLLVASIPLVGFILLIVWATGNDVNRSKKTFCQAYLTFIGIGVLLYFAILIPIITSLANSGF